MVDYAPAIDLECAEQQASHHSLWKGFAHTREYDVVDNYTGGGYDTINQALRDDRIGEAVRKHVEAIERVHAVAPILPAGSVLWRGIADPSFFGDLDALVGTTWTEHGFLSTAVAEEGSRRFLPNARGSEGTGLLVRLRLASALPAVYMPWMPEPSWPREFEALLPRGCRLHFLSMSPVIDDSAHRYRQAEAALFPPIEETA